MIDCMEECRLRVRVKDMGLDIFFPTIKAMVQMLEQNVDLAQGYRKIAEAPAFSTHAVILSPRLCWRRFLA